jgi:pimeloyl-ACP methyl ester carboxylesterase
VYDQDFFVSQLAGLLDSLRITTAVDLAGLSFGGAIVTSFADRHPERVRSLIYVDPVFNTGRQLPPEERSALAWSLHMVLRGGSDEIATGQLFDFLHPERHPDWVPRYRVQQQFEGTREALRRTRAAIALAPHQEEQLRRLGAHPRPVLVVWGREDRVSPFTNSRPLLAAMPRATFVPVDSAAHLPHLEQPGVVIPAVVRFLRRSPLARLATCPGTEHFTFGPWPTPFPTSPPPCPTATASSASSARAVWPPSTSPRTSSIAARWR